VADPNQQRPAITFWLLGGFNGVRVDQLPPLLGILGVCLVVLWLCRWRLNVIAFSDESARTLGVDVGAVRLIVVVCATLMTTASVSVGGLISWVGLVVPHLVRLTVGPDFRRLLPLAALAGAIFLLVVDDIARNLWTMELPLGILTALVGGPFMLALILRDRSW
jgi:iron complex transport system permease protein